MIIDGRKIAEKMYEDMRLEISRRERAPRLAIITCAPNFETQKYLALKEKKATQAGIETDVITLSNESATEDFLATINACTKTADGIIVQLPLPPHVATASILAAVPITHDVDALNPNTTQVLSPVVGAIAEILRQNRIESKEKYVTIIGAGRLVGVPALRWFESEGAYVSVVTKETIDIVSHTKNADIIVCGAGVPGLLTPDMIKDGVVILDAGTSEEGGMLRGDATSECAEKASLFTPVPGGIGPVTIAVLLKNLIVLARNE